jgi:hypothetical protein
MSARVRGTPLRVSQNAGGLRARPVGAGELETSMTLTESKTPVTMSVVIEIAGPRTIASFDGRVLELFWPDHSRRIHVEQILYAEVQHGELMLEPSATLNLWLVHGERVSASFAAVRELELQQLIALLPARV